MIKITSVPNTPMKSILRSFGYTWQGMKLLGIWQVLHDNRLDGEVLLLYPDGTDAYCNNWAEVMNHCLDGGLIGTEFYIKRKSFTGQIVRH